ncbi:MAG: hypothetical protein ACRERS_10885, partial [Methylococcales bacterium]
PTLKHWIDDEKGAEKTYRALIDRYEEWKGECADATAPRLERFRNQGWGRLDDRLLRRIIDDYAVNKYGREWAKRYSSSEVYHNAMHFFRRTRNLVWLKKRLVGLSVFAFVLIVGF